MPFPPGGPVDVTARIVAQPLAPILGQPVVIENRGGASGAIGAKAVAAAEPDGYTLLVRQHQLAGGDAGRQPATATTIRPRRSRRSPSCRRTTRCWWCIRTFRPKSVRELIAYAKANPGKLNLRLRRAPATPAIWRAELFKLKTGIDIVHVPYKGAAEAVTGVIGGQVQMFFGDIGGMLPLIREGRLRALALSERDAQPRACPTCRP